MQRMFLLAGMTALLAAPPAQAQNACAEYGKTPPVGGWSEWQSDQGKVRLSVIGTEKKDGKDLYWIEMQGASQGGPNGRGGQGILQLLVSGFPYDAAGIQGMVMKMEGQPAMKANDQMLSMMKTQMHDNPASAALRDCSTWTKVGEESVTVPAGSFQTLHLKDNKTGNEVWVSKDVPFGMVKGNMTKTGEITLTATGKDAKSSITETPVDMGNMMKPQ